jgi:putative DNA methylase
VSVPIDTHFDVLFADDIARFESYNKHLYRPNTYLHKWWARRCGSTFRSILKALVENPLKRDYYSPGGLEGKIILDPMMGGGTTLHEAIRLGASVVGADIDPIPVLQARATLSDLPLADLEEQFALFFDRVREQLAPLYETVCPHCEAAAELRYVLYGQRRFCLCNEALIVDSLILRRNSDGSVVHLAPGTNDVYLDDTLVARAHQSEQQIILEKGTRDCDRCGETYREKLTVPYYQRYAPVAVAGRCHEHALFYHPPGPLDLQMLAAADEGRQALGFNPVDFLVAEGPKSKALLRRNITSYLELFSSRQLHYVRYAIEALAKLKPSIRLNLALLVSTSLEFNSLLCGYKGVQTRRSGSIRHVFSHHAYAFPTTALENNPVQPSKSSGTLKNLFHSRIVRGRKWAMKPVERRVKNGATTKVVIKDEVDAGVEVDNFTGLQRDERRFMLMQGSSIDLQLPSNSVDYIVTDPPYFDNVQYGDLATFFRTWLAQLLPGNRQWHYPLADAAIDPQVNGDAQYGSILAGIFVQCHRVLKRDGRLIFTFHHWKPQGWVSLTIALKRAGFRLVNRYVVHAENRASVHIVNQNALLHDVILVLAPVESTSIPHWEKVDVIDASSSRLFCHQCGTALGWMLDSRLDDEEIDSVWHALLA